MRTSCDQIASKINNCSFSLQSLEKFLAMMATQQSVFSDISYKASGAFTLVLRAKKNGIVEIALKVLECTDQTESQIQEMEREYAMCKQLPSSDYFVAIQDQFYLTEMDESAEQDQFRNSNTARKVFFVQQMEMCQGSLYDAIQQYSQQNQDSPTEELKELLAIQMLDAVNLLHQRQIAHGNITAQHFLFSPSSEYPVLLKMYNFRFISSVPLRDPTSQVSSIESLNCMPHISVIQRDCLQQDLVSLGKILLQLNSIGSKGDYSTRFSNSDLAVQPAVTTTLETHQLNMSTQLYKIGYSLLNNSRENSQSARSMLLLLLKKQTSVLKIPLFSIVLRSQVDSLRLPVQSKRIRLDYIVWQLRKELKIHNIASWFNSEGKRKTELTVDLLKSALEIMLEWKEFNGDYDVLGVGVGGVVFGVDNLKEQRKSALKLSLCINKAETIREIGIMRMCQAPCIVKYYGCKFFKDDKGNEFVVYELERCKYSLIHHLELQRTIGEYSVEQKNLLILQMINSVKYLHENGILHRNIKIGNFLMSENESGQSVVKLNNFSHAAQLQESFIDMTILEEQLFKLQYESPVNCIFQRHNRESPLYFAPERWENPDLSTYLTDSYSVGLCIFLLDNYLVYSEEQLARKLFSVPRGSQAISCNNNPLISSKTELKTIVKLLLMPLPQQRKFLKYFDENFPPYKKEEKGISKDLEQNIFQQKTMLTIKDRQGLEEIKSDSMRFVNLYNVSLNLNKILIEDKEAESLLNLISYPLNMSRISVNCTSSSILSIGTLSLLPSLSKLINLSSLSLSLFKNNIGNIEAQSLLSPLANLHNLSIIFLNLSENKIGGRGAQSLLCPLANLLNLSSISLNLSKNTIVGKGDQSLLSPLSNLFNLTSISLDLNKNQIGDKGAQCLLSPLANLLNLSSISLELNENQIGDIGAQYLLSPLVNLLNLSSISLDLIENKMGDIGAQSRLYRLADLLNLSNISLNQNEKMIGEIGGQFLLSPLVKFLNLSRISLNLRGNKIGDRGAQSLLSPLVHTLNLSSISLYLKRITIGDIGAQSLLSPLANLLNLSNIFLNLSENKIRDKGAQSLLSPLANLYNLSIIFLNLSENKIGDIGPQSMLSPLSNIFNLTSISLNLNKNQIGDIGALCLLSPLANLLNLANISLDLNENQIGDIGASSLLSPLANLTNLSNFSLDISSNNICNKGSYSLFQHLSNLISLQSLTLSLDKNQIIKKANHLFKNYLIKLQFLNLKD